MMESPPEFHVAVVSLKLGRIWVKFARTKENDEDCTEIGAEEGRMAVQLSLNGTALIHAED
jgi:hypothetical protein